METKKKTTEIEIEGKTKNYSNDIKLKDQLDSVSKNSLIKSLNPIENLSFQDVAEDKKISGNVNFFLVLFVVVLLSASVLLSSYFSKNLDPVLYKSVSSCLFCVKGNIDGVKNIVTESLTSHYVVTVGEYGNMVIAMEEAKRLLPKLKQIYIKELESGILTLEIDRSGSKKEAYKLAGKLMQDGFEVVHVRYLPDK